MKKILLFICALFTVISASAYKKDSLFVDVDGQNRNIIVFTPKKVKKNLPLMIVTHGMNQNPEYQYQNDKFYQMVDTAKFVVAYLRSDGNTWDTQGNKDKNFVRKSIDFLTEKYKTDPKRVYWSGFSMGSMLMYHCMGEMQDKVAVFAPTSGIQVMEQP